MNRSVFRVASVLFVACTLAWSAPAFAGDAARLYVEGDFGGSFLGFGSGGYNTAGSFPNTGSDSDGRALLGLAVGGKFLNMVRADLSFVYRPEFDVTTNSFEPPVPTVFYNTDVQTESLLFSVYFEPFTFKKITPYIGGGVGCTWIDLSTYDTEVAGSRDDANFTWHAEAGLQYELTDHFGVKVGYRYLDIGKVDCPLDGGTAGNFTADMNLQEVIFGVRYTF